MPSGTPKKRDSHRLIQLSPKFFKAHYPKPEIDCCPIDRYSSSAIVMYLQTMQLEFVPVEDFYFALTLCNKPLEEIDDPDLTAKIGLLLKDRFGQSSTVAAAQQNTFHYVFHVLGVDHEPAPQLVVSISDWHDKLRLNSDYGWNLDADRKPMRTDKFQERDQFAQQLKVYLKETFALPLT